MKALVEGTVKNGGKKRTDAVPSVAANFTDIRATLVDNGGTVWAGAYITCIFVPTPNTPGPYFWGDPDTGGGIMGGPDSPAMWNVRADPNGYIDFHLQDNMTITPSGSMWQFIIAPNATQPAVVFNLMIAGYIMDISSIFTSQSYQIQNSLVQGLVLPRAYSDAEVAFPPFAGALYYNSAAHQVKVFTGGGGWDALLGGGWQVVPPGTPASSLGTGASFFAPTGFPDGPTEFNGQPTVLVNFPEFQISYSGKTDSQSWFYRLYDPNVSGWAGWWRITSSGVVTSQVDLNTFVVPGIFVLEAGTTANAPSNITNSAGAMLEVFTAPNPCFAQRLVCPVDPAHYSSIYHRVYVNGAWQPWFELTGTQV